MSFGRLQRRAGAKPMSDINMTPLIDVMLVLLVIFIISAPLLARSLQLDLPASDAATSSNAPATLELAVDGEGRLYIGTEQLAPATAQARISSHVRAAARRNPATEVQLRADSRVPYGRVAELIGWVQQAGLSRVGLVTQASPETMSGRTQGATPGMPPETPAPAATPAPLPSPTAAPVPVRPATGG